ncbi:hypothetical protein BpHYR1_012564 [Brachionus plicatilis]|uniref:Uncharacterized protein n=1 Tax=Brachionus plicatilis TaxID=10195 RepID=A0A3M7PK41_BRAPC|nr:hypothetical protein BpHYR1_012564 [Brachionus plicatilis]
MKSINILIRAGVWLQGDIFELEKFLCFFALCNFTFINSPHISILVTKYVTRDYFYFEFFKTINIEHKVALDFLRPNNQKKIPTIA